MAGSTQGKPPVIETEAVVIGAGLTGVAAAIHLARSGFRVVCVEQRQQIDHIVGESLDWSAPELLANLGLPMEELVSTEAATWKRHVRVSHSDGGHKDLLPGKWLAESPWNVEIRTLHLDRARTDARLRNIARQLDVTMLNERVTDLCVLDEASARKRRILGLRTAEGTFVRGSWFIDASGGDTSLLARRFDLQPTSFGPRKVAIWTHVPTEEWAEGTTLYMAVSPGKYAEWIWEIPIRPGWSSIGYIAPGASIKAQRVSGLRAEDILVRQCGNFPRLKEIVDQAKETDVATTSFLCRTYQGVCGSNWFIIGEAASQSDPITGNGVTAALRHAEEATALIRWYRHRSAIPAMARTLYNRRVSSVGHYFNSLIEKLFYQPVLRDRMGTFSTGRFYTVPAWLLNLIYTRMRPSLSAWRTLAIVSIMDATRLITWFAYQVGSLLPAASGPDSHQPATAAMERNYAV